MLYTKHLQVSFWLLISLLINLSIQQQTAFKSITENLNFRAIYGIETFVEGQTSNKLINVRESYHSSPLAAGLVRQTVHQRQNENYHIDRQWRKFHYDTGSRRLIEFSSKDKDNDHHQEEDHFYLYENGGSQSYSGRGGAKIKSSSSSSSSSAEIRLVPQGKSLDSILLLGVEDDFRTLDLSAFMRADCLDYLAEKLHYINGVTRLLLLIECRRDEFKFHFAEGTTRGLARRAYLAKKLTWPERGKRSTGSGRDSSLVKELEISLTIPLTSGQRRTDPENTLPADFALPLSVGLTFDDGTTNVLINVFQFESLAPGEHLSEWASSLGGGANSIYLLPLASFPLEQALASTAASSMLHNFRSSEARHSFSFHATLTGSAYAGAEPIELVVAYDQAARQLATQMSFLDRKSSEALEGWRRHTISTLQDGHSGLRYHLMRENFGHLQLDELGLEVEPEASKESRWRSCVVDELTGDELNALRDSSALELLGLSPGESSVRFMGQSLVRGIVCNVFQRRLTKLPNFLGLSMNDYLHHSSKPTGGIYQQVYLAAVDAEQVSEGPHITTGPLDKLVRLDIGVLAGGGSESMLLDFRLEVHAFEWTTHVLKDVPDMLEVPGECYATGSGGRHAELELWLELARSSANWDQLRALDELRWDVELRNQAISRMLAEWPALALGRAQQVGVETEMVGVDEKSSESFYVKVGVFDEPEVSLYEQFLGYAQLMAGPVARLQGARVHSYEACKWRAGHSLPGESGDIWTQGGEQQARVFAYWPLGMRCILGDSSWLPARSLMPISVPNTLNFPYDVRNSSPSPPPSSSLADRCVMAAVELRERRRARGRRVGGSVERLVQWKRDDELFSLPTNQKQQVSSSSDLNANSNANSNSQLMELKVGTTIVTLRVIQSKVEEFISNDNDNHDDHWPASSLLKKPLRGLSYLSTTTTMISNSNLPESSRQTTQMAPLIEVENVAQCARACLLTHLCASYSVCHKWGQSRKERQKQLTCTFSSFNWSQRRHYEQLLKLTKQQREQTFIKLELSNRTVQVHFKRSNLCTLHGRPQFDELFKLASQIPFDTRRLVQNGTLLYARTRGECAHLCLERAHLMRQLSGVTSANTNTNDDKTPITPLKHFRSAPCLEFLYSWETRTCELLPRLDHWQLLNVDHRQSITRYNSSNKDIVDTWGAWLEATPTREWRNRMEAAAAAEITQQFDRKSLDDHYELDMSQLFEGRPGIRLMMMTTPLHNNSTNAQRLQLSLPVNFRECARKCAQLFGCRSFDLLSSSPEHKLIGLATTTECVLNARTLAQLSGAGSDPEAPLEPTESSNWWHYEPSELALFLISEAREFPPAAAAAARNDEDDNLANSFFLNVSL